jgi:hypothetical protein
MPDRFGPEYAEICFFTGSRVAYRWAQQIIEVSVVPRFGETEACQVDVAAADYGRQ